MGQKLHQRDPIRPLFSSNGVIRERPKRPGVIRQKPLPDQQMHIPGEHRLGERGRLVESLRRDRLFFFPVRIPQIKFLPELSARKKPQGNTGYMKLVHLLLDLVTVYRM